MGDGSPEWKKKKFRELLNVRDDKQLAAPEVPLYSLTIEDGVCPKGDRYNREFLVKDSATKLYKTVRHDDLVFNPANLRYGAIARSKLNFDVLVSPIYVILYCKESREMIPAYLEYLSTSDFMHCRYLKYVEGTLVERTALSVDHFLELDIDLPPLEEQEKIADILSSVDDVIENTQTQINKLSDLKKATMNELLTKGIGHTEFRESDLGLIPTTWEIKNLGDFGEIQNGINKAAEDFGSGTKLVNITDIYARELDTENLGRVRTTEQDLSTYSLNPGNLLFVRSSVKLEGVAMPCVFQGDDEPVVFSGFLLRFEIIDVAVNSYYLKEYFLWSRTRRLIERVATKSANININQPALLGFQVLLPPLEEQKKIVDILTSLDDQIEVVESKLVQLESLKKSLMQDLLTGKVRVKAA